MLTTQKAYEKIRAWLTRPNARQCIDVSGDCLYEDHTGNRCAIGAILSKEALDLADGQVVSVMQLIDLYPSIGKELSKCDTDFLADAQNLHDNVNNWNENGFEFNVATLDKLALQYDLRVVK